MKIRDGLKETINGKIVLLNKYVIEEERSFPNSPLRNTITLSLNNQKTVKCSWCERMNTNWCWNCEKPHCDKHAKAVFIACLVNTLCEDCSKELEKINELR